MKKAALTLVFSVVIGCYLLWIGIKEFRTSGNDKHTVNTEKVLVHKDYNHIVSLSPSITETLFALGLGKKVVGVTQFCKYPPETAEKTKVGGWSHF